MVKHLTLYNLKLNFIDLITCFVEDISLCSNSTSRWFTFSHAWKQWTRAFHHMAYQPEKHPWEGNEGCLAEGPCCPVPVTEMKSVGVNCNCNQNHCCEICNLVLTIYISCWVFFFYSGLEIPVVGGNCPPPLLHKTI